MMSSLTKYSNSVMTLFILTIFVVMLIVASRYPAGARFMPFVLGIPAVLLCLLQLALDARERHLTTKAAGLSDIKKAEAQVSRLVGHKVHFDVGDLLLPPTDLDPREQMRRELIAWGYFLSFIAGIILFGFHLAVPMFLVCFLRFHARANWMLILGLTGGATFVLFYAFEYVLRVSLHKGFIIEYLFD